jgi:hypothetical protein
LVGVLVGVWVFVIVGVGVIPISTFSTPVIIHPLLSIIFNIYCNDELYGGGILKT